MSYSGKFLYLMSGEDPPVEKTRKMGCMAGILQIFDRHHFRNLRGNRRITAGGSPGMEPVENIDDDPRGSVDSSKLPRRMLAFRGAEGNEESRRSEGEFPYRLSPGLRNKSHRRTHSTESFQVPNWECEDDSMESARNFTVRSRFSCDGREIPRPPPVVDHRDAYRSSSLRTMEFPRISVGVPDSPSRRPSNIVAKLMGLAEMPDPPLEVRKAKDPAPTKPSAPPSPRPLAAKILLDMIHQPNSMSQPKHKSESVIHQPVSLYQPKPKSESVIQAQRQNNNPARLDCLGKDSNLCLTAKNPAEQSCRKSSDVKEVLDEAEKAVKIYTCSDPKLPGIKTKSVEKFGSLSPVRDESGAFSSSSSSKSPQMTKKLGDDMLPKRSKRNTHKMPQEISNTVSPHKHSPRFRSEISPPRSPKDDPNEKRMKKAVEIRLDKTRFKRDEESSPPACCNSDSKFCFQSPMAKRSSDFSPKSRRHQVNSKASNQACKAEQKSAAKSCEKEFIPDLAQPEEPNLMRSTEKYLQKRTARSGKEELTPDWQPAEPNLMQSADNILQETPARSCKEEFILDWQPAEPNVMHSTENILQETTGKPCEKECISQEPDLMHSAENILQKTTAKPRDKYIISEHSEEPDLFDSTENILQKPEPRDSFHCNHRSQSNEFNVRDYVTDLFTACGLLKEGEEEKELSLDFYFPGNFSIDSHFFHELEKKYRNDEETDAERSNRRVLFDTVNEVLRRKSGVPPYSRIPQRDRGGCSSRRLMMSGNDVVNSVVMEIESLTSVKCGNTTNRVNKLLEKDLETSNSEAMDMSEVVLAVERGIYRDLMDEFLHDLLFN